MGILFHRQVSRETPSAEIRPDGGQNEVVTDSPAFARLDAGLRSLGIVLPDGAATRLLEVLERIQASPHNLTGITGIEEGVDRHLLDSLVALDVPEVTNASRIADVGSGGGFPGLALAAALPGVAVTLIESVSRKAVWLESTTDLFPNVTVVAERSELAAEALDSFDLVTARALAPGPVALELCAPLTAIGGHVLLWTGHTDSERDARTALAAEYLRLSPCRVVPVEPFPGADRRLLLFDKSQPTPEKFPRRPGRAGSHPIA